MIHALMVIPSIKSIENALKLQHAPSVNTAPTSLTADSSVLMELTIWTQHAMLEDAQLAILLTQPEESALNRLSTQAATILYSCKAQIAFKHAMQASTPTLSPEFAQLALLTVSLALDPMFAHHALLEPVCQEMCALFPLTHAQLDSSDTMTSV